MKEKSIAVLPFLNLSPDPENEYFSDGITEEIINALTTIKGLNVTARTSSFVFKNRNVDIRTIGAQLGVAVVLEGSVRKDRNRIRITAQLIDSSEGFHIWSKSFNRELQDIFALQDEVSLLIADQIRENFGHLEIEDHLFDSSEISVESYDLYLKGKHCLNSFNKEQILKGIDLLRQASEQQPNFALAYANIHYGYNLLAAAGLMPTEEALGNGLKYLELALELDDRLPECYHSLGWHSLNRDWNFIKARENLTKAIELSPAYADAHQKLFITFALEGKQEAAHEHLSIALKLDPLSPLNHYFRGYYFYLRQQYEEANASFKRCFDLEPRFLFAYSIYGLSLIALGQAHVLLEKAAVVPDIEGGTLESLIMKGLAYCSLKDRQNANQALLQLQVYLEGEEGERIRYYLIHMKSMLQEYEDALDFIDQGIAKREPLMTLLREDPLLKTLHDFERFQLAMLKVFALSDDAVAPKMQSPAGLPLDSEPCSYKLQLEQLFAEKPLYLDPALSLRSLADSLQIHPNKLSWLLNEHYGKNFNEYINTYRLEAFKQKALDPANKHLTLLALAYESGFNSKTVFNTFFKRSIGMSPRAWLKSYSVRL